MPLISVIIPAHNEEKYLPATLHSLAEQTFRGYEIIVVANGCTDRTETTAKVHLAEMPAYAPAQHAPVRIITLPQASVSRARNAGAKQAQGDILLFLDADTCLPRDALQAVHRGFSPQHAVGTTLARPDTASWKFSLAMGLKNWYLRSGMYKGCSGVLFCRKRDFQAVGGYDESIMVKEHRKLILRLRQTGRYCCLPITAITSMRRYRQWGLAKGLLYWSGQWIKDKTVGLQESNYECIR